jgi:hypothetical protein
MSTKRDDETKVAPTCSVDSRFNFTVGAISIVAALLIVFVIVL